MNRNVRTTLLLLLVAAAACRSQQDELTVSGLIEGISVEAGSRIGGRVAEVFVAEGAKVEEGEVLVKLESSELEAAVAVARAQVDQAQAQLEKIQTGARKEEIEQAEAALAQTQAHYDMAVDGARSQEIEGARAGLDAARAQLDEAMSEYERAERLFNDKVISRQLYDKARYARNAAEAQHRAAGEQLNLAEEGARTEEIEMARAARDQAAALLEQVTTGARSEDIAMVEAARAAAQGQLELAEANLREMTVVSPMDGVVESLDVHPGDLVQPGPIVRITDPDHLEVVVYVSAGVLGSLQLGQEIILTTDSFGDETFTANIIQIATQGEFTPRNLQTREERVQQMFGVKLALESHGGRLRAGMTVIAHFDVNGGGGA